MLLTPKYNISIILSIVLWYGCNKNLHQSQDCTQIGTYRICIGKSKHTLQSTIDGNVGTLHNRDFTVDYEYSAAAYEGPESDKEYFMKVFRNYHYLKYFDSIHIDKKVQKIYRDSVKLISLRHIDFKPEACTACNYEAILQFRQFVTPFYFFVSQDLMDQWNSTTSSFDTIGTNVIKTYSNSTEKGLWIKSVNATRQSEKLSLQFKRGDFEAFVKDVKGSFHR